MSALSQLKDIFKDFPFNIISKLPKPLLEAVGKSVGIKYTNKRDMINKIISVDSLPDNVDRTDALEFLHSELKKFLKQPSSSRDQEEESGDEEQSDEGESEPEEIDHQFVGQKRKRTMKDVERMNIQFQKKIQEQEKELEDFRNQVQYLVNRGKDQYQEESSDEEEVVVKKRKQSKKPDADVLNKIVINEEVRKYIDSTFRPFPFTSEQLSNEYERVKGMARDAMTVHLMTGSEEALNMVKSLEDNAFQIQMVATDSKVAQKLSLLQNNALWRNNVEKVQIATKLAKLDQKEAKTGTNGYQKANLMAKAFNPKNPKEEKDERKETPNRNFGEKRCFKCQSPHHLLNQCPMNDVNKHPRSEYLPFCFLFTRGDPGEIQSYPQHFQPVEGLGTKKCFTRSSRNAKGRCSCRGFRGVQKVPWKGQSRQMGPKGKGMVSERISYPQGNWCYRALSERRSGCQVSSGSKKRLLQINHRPKAFKQVLQGSKIQIQDFEKVLGICAKNWRNIWLHVRYEVGLSPTKDTPISKEVLCDRDQWRAMAVYRFAIWLEWITVCIYLCYERVCENVKIGLVVSVQLLRRYWDTAFWRVCHSIKKPSNDFHGLHRAWHCNRTIQECFTTDETVQTVRYDSGFGIQNVDNDNSYNFENQTSYWFGIESQLLGFVNNGQRSFQDHWYCNCLLRLFPAGASHVKSYLLIGITNGKYWWLGLFVLPEGKRSNPQSAMDYCQSGILERKAFPVPKFSELLLDGCFQKWMGSILQRRKLEDTWKMVTDREGSSHKRVGGKSDLDSLKSMEGQVTREKLDYLYRLDGGCQRHQKRKCQKSSDQQDDHFYLENNLRLGNGRLLCLSNLFLCVGFDRHLSVCQETNKYQIGRQVIT